MTDLTPNLILENHIVNLQLNDLANHIDSGNTFMNKKCENEDIFYYLDYLDKNDNGAFYKLVFYGTFEAWIHLTK